jgi:hypothetical protein
MTITNIERNSKISVWAAKSVCMKYGKMTYTYNSHMNSISNFTGFMVIGNTAGNVAQW